MNAAPAASVERIARIRSAGDAARKRAASSAVTSAAVGKRRSPMFMTIWHHEERADAETAEFAALHSTAA
jgi:hypothetical protein